VEYDQWAHEITHHTFIHENVKDVMSGFRYDATDGMLASMVAASAPSTRGQRVATPEVRRKQIHRLIRIPTWPRSPTGTRSGCRTCTRTTSSATRQLPADDVQESELKVQVHPALEKALDVLFILHADHEQNCSTSAMRSIGSSEADPTVRRRGDRRPLRPLHGGANEAVLRMLQEIGSRQGRRLVKDVKESGGDVR